VQRRRQNYVQHYMEQFLPPLEPLYAVHIFLYLKPTYFSHVYVF